MTELSRDELVALVDRVQSVSGCRVDLDGLLEKLEAALPGSDISRWIFDPPDGRRRTSEELVDLAQAHRRR